MNRTIYGNAAVLAGLDLNVITTDYVVVVDSLTKGISVGYIAKAVNPRKAILVPTFIDVCTHIADSGMKDAFIGGLTVEAVSSTDGLKYRYLQNYVSRLALGG